MKSFTDDQKSSKTVYTNRSESLTTSDFTAYAVSDPFYNSLKNLFYNDDLSPIEYVPDQELQTLNDFVYFQIPYEQRGDSVVPNKFTITNGTDSITDDGNGNLVDANDGTETIIGNIFYETGVIVITSDNNFTNSGTPIKTDIAGNSVTINYQRKAFFIHNKYYIDIDQDEYTYSTNETFKDSDAPHPFLTSVSLFNNKNQLIAVARLSKPISTETDIFLILDDLETL